MGVSKTCSLHTSVLLHYYTTFVLFLIKSHNGNFVVGRPLSVKSLFSFHNQTMSEVATVFFFLLLVVIWVMFFTCQKEQVDGYPTYRMSAQDQQSLNDLAATIKAREDKYLKKGGDASGAYFASVKMLWTCERCGAELVSTANQNDTVCDCGGHYVNEV